MSSGFAKNFPNKVGGTIDDGRLFRKTIGRCHKAHNFQHPFDIINANKCVNGGQCVECGLAGIVGPLFDSDIRPKLADGR